MIQTRSAITGFDIITDAGVVGTVYIPKDLKPMPKTITLTYQSKEDD